MKTLLRTFALTLLCSGLALPLTAQTATPAVTEHSAANATSTFTADQLIPMTIHEAWTASGKDEATFFDMVKVLAEYSSQKRGIVLPDTHADGVKFGEYIKMHAKSDPDQLLYVVVDEAVRHVGKVTTAAAAK